jgi:hypothetical protein
VADSSLFILHSAFGSLSVMSGSLAGFAAEPITPRGMVAFAYGTFTRLWLAQFLTAVLVAVSVLWFFDDSVAPTIEKAINNLAGNGEIVSGELVWHGESPKVLAEERVLALDIDLDHSDQIHCTSDVQVEFGRDSIRVFSLPGSLIPGFLDFYYPDNPPPQSIPVSRENLDPLWGAWLPEIQAVLLATVTFSLLVLWTVLASIYWLPVWLFSFLAGRDLGLLASWRLAGASLLPGGLLLALAFFLYDFGVLDVVQFCFAVSAHLLLAWLYLFVSLLFLPRRAGKATGKNPFVPAK